MTRFFGFPKKKGKVEPGFSGTRKMSAFFRVPEKNLQQRTRIFGNPKNLVNSLLSKNSKSPNKLKVPAGKKHEGGVIQQYVGAIIRRKLAKSGHLFCEIVQLFGESMQLFGEREPDF